MELQNIEIHTQDSDVEVAHKINSMELHNWINHLAYVGEELKSLVTFFNSQSSKKWMEREKLSQRFQIIMFDNNVINRQLQNFLDSRTSIVECQDMKCNISFIQEHEKCRRMYQFHIDKYRKMKDTFFTNLQRKINEQVKSA
jgi:hypothetical protein